MSNWYIGQCLFQNFDDWEPNFVNLFLSNLNFCKRRQHWQLKLVEANKQTGLSICKSFFLVCKQVIIVYTSIVHHVVDKTNTLFPCTKISWKPIWSAWLLLKLCRKLPWTKKARHFRTTRIDHNSLHFSR